MLKMKTQQLYFLEVSPVKLGPEERIVLSGLNVSLV